MKAVCDSVIERVALGEPLGELAEHVASCPPCQRLIEMPTKLGASRHPVDPGLGFAARMTVGARQRIAVRRHQRIAAGFAAAVAAGVVGVFVMTRAPDSASQQPAASEHPRPEPHDKPEVADEADLTALVRLADTHRSSHLSAPWARITRSLAPYKKLVKGVTP
ncbi:MAG: hypothetical protein H6Q90_4866 [Deltaproteobacteria bacterium]|nr:hypothetical protein [Deltaproteobacteria bacterium]